VTSPALAPDSITSTARSQARQARAARRTERRWAWGSAGLAALATAIIAAPGLNNELFRDEAVTADVAARTPGQVLDLLGTIDVGHALLYSLVNVLPIDSGSPWQVRLVSLLPVVAAGAILAAWASSFLGRSSGLLVALTWPLMPATVGVSLFARDYGLATLFALLSTLALVGGLMRPPGSDGLARRVWWGYVAALVLMVHCNLFALFLLPAHAVAVFLLRRDRRDAVMAWVRSSAIAVAACLPLVVAIARQPDPISWVAPPLLRDLVIIPNRILGGSGYGTDEAPSGAAVLTVLLLALCAWAVIRTLREWLHHREQQDIAVVTVVLATAWLLVPVVCSALVSLERPVFVARYLWFIAPAVVLLLATLPRATRRAVGAQPDGPGRLTKRGSLAQWWWVAAVPLVVLVAGAGPRAGLLAPQGEVDYRGAVTYLAASARPGDVFVSDDPSYNFLRSGLGAAAGGVLPVRDVLVARTGAERGDISAEEFPQEAWGRLLANSDRVWVVAKPGDEPGPREAAVQAGRERVEDRRFDGLILRLYAASKTN